MFLENDSKEQYKLFLLKDFLDPMRKKKSLLEILSYVKKFRIYFLKHGKYEQYVLEEDMLF